MSIDEKNELASIRNLAGDEIYEAQVDGFKAMVTAGYRRVKPFNHVGLGMVGYEATLGTEKHILLSTAAFTKAVERLMDFSTPAMPMTGTTRRNIDSRIDSTPALPPPDDQLRIMGRIVTVIKELK